MNRLQKLLTCILCGGILALAFDTRWAYSIQQVLLYTLLVIAQRRLRFHWLVLPIAGCVMIGLLQLAGKTTAQSGATWIASLDWFSWAVAFLLGVALAGESVLTAIAGFSGAISILAIAWRFSRIMDGVPNGPMAPFAYENQFAVFIEITLPLALLLAARGKRLWMLLAAVMIASVMVSGSQAGAILVTVEAILLLLILARQSGNYKAVWAIGSMAAVIVAITGWQLLERDFRRQNPYEVRRELALSTIEMIKDRPITGFGLGTWSTVYPAYATFDDGLFDNQAHNDWLQWAAEGGVPMATLMFLFACGLFVRTTKSTWAIGLLCCLAHALVDYPFQQRPALACFFFAMAGMASGSPELSRGPRLLWLGQRK